MKDVFFSVIVTAYNQHIEIQRAVDSVLNQTIKCFELIVVDDCSTDNTLEILKKYENSNPSLIKIIHLPINSSSHVARCIGTENATGKFILFLDGDDYFVPDALEMLLLKVVKGNEAFDVCEFSYICQPSGEIVNPSVYNSNIPRIDYFLSNVSKVTVWNKLYRAELIKEAFSNMKKEYIRCGDDTYESIIIAFYTQKFIQRNILITNYTITGGVSFRKNSYESNLRHCESLFTSLNCLKSFFEINDYESKALLVQTVEKKYFEWILSVMKNNTEIEDIVKSLILLPKFFSVELIEPQLKKQYKTQLRIKRIKNFLHRFI